MPVTIQDGLRLNIESEWCFSIGSCASDYEAKEEAGDNSQCVFQRVEGQGCSRTLLGRAPRCHGMRDLRADMSRRKEIVHGGGGRRLRVRRICNVAKNVVI